MAVVDARVRVHHPCPYCDISVGFPRSLLLLWCDNRRDVFLVSSPDARELRAVLAALRDSFHAECLLRDGTSALVEVPDFEWDSPPSVTGLARKGGVWTLHPVLYSEGSETYRLVSPNRPRLNRLIKKLRRLGDVEILSVSEKSGLESVRDLPTASIHFFEGLTPRQTKALLAAYDGGLFDVPARSSWSAVAKAAGVSRSTFGEHLRKAQMRILRNSYATLRARDDAGKPPVLLAATGPQPRTTRGPMRGAGVFPAD